MAADKLIRAATALVVTAVAAFADVVLRGLALSGQAMAIGGVLFALLILRPVRSASA